MSHRSELERCTPVTAPDLPLRKPLSAKRHHASPPRPRCGPRPVGLLRGEAEQAGDHAQRLAQDRLQIELRGRLVREPRRHLRHDHDQQPRRGVRLLDVEVAEEPKQSFDGGDPLPITRVRARDLAAEAAELVGEGARQRGILPVQCDVWTAEDGKPEESGSDRRPRPGNGDPTPEATGVPEISCTGGR